jgi:hypothetical protein
VEFYASAAIDGNKMNSMVTVLLIVVSMLPSTGSSTPKGWRGIVPLHSNRSDVERLLGPGTGTCKCQYYLNDMNVFFNYSPGDCRSGRGGWDVPVDTVVWITVYPKPHLKLSELALDLTKFKKRQGTLIPEFLYDDEEKGLTLDTYEDNVQAFVQAFIYGPIAADKHLRCH